MKYSFLMKTMQLIADGEAVIIDDFPLDWLETPLADRTFNLSTELDNFPGTIDALTPSEREKFLDALEIASGLRLVRESVYVRLRRALPGARSRSFIHSDFYSLAGVLYLSPLPASSTAEDFGTHFYRHQKTGWDRVPKMERLKQTARHILTTETNDLDRWTRVHSVPYRQNRLVLYSGYLFHSPPLAYQSGISVETRVTLDFFARFT